MAPRSRGFSSISEVEVAQTDEDAAALTAAMVAATGRKCGSCSLCCKVPPHRRQPREACEPVVQALPPRCGRLHDLAAGAAGQRWLETLL